MGTNAGTDISGWMIRGGAIFTAIFSNSWPLDNLDSDQTRRIYYQVTGEAFNTREPEFWRGRFMGGTFRHPAAVTEIDWDPHIGEGQVGTRVKGLSMKNSRIDAHLDPLSELSYQEWTIDFKNISSVDREARMQLQLPYGGTVSRVTLWVHGEPQEAAFASRSKVKKAYQQIAVAQRRDPLLVTACGPDRVMVQCFPILPGKEMKIRLGITAPMTKGQVSFPKILERNFRFNEDLRHQIWAQSTDPFQLNDERAMKGKHQYELQSSLNDLRSSQLQWSTDHTAVGSVWCHDPFATTGEEILVRTAELTDDLACERLAIVVDGSRSLKKDENVLKTALARILKEHSHIRIFLANEKVAVLSTPSMIDQIKFKGGHSNGPALLKALQWVGSVEESAVVWLHGAQPIDFAEDRQLEQFFERSSTRIPLYSVPLTGGSHRILEKLFQHNTVHAAPQMLDLEADLPAYIEEFLSGKRKSWKWERRSSGKEPTIIPKVWDQLARFWAADQISQMESSQKDDKEMIDTAAHYQVITAYSGAVVLEEAAQYKRFGLEQVDTQTTPTVPTVPEPSTSLLIILATASLLSKRNRTTRMGRNNSQ